MPLRQNFGNIRQPVEAVSPLIKALSNVQQTFANMEATDMKQAAMDESTRRYEADAAESARRHNEGMLLREAANRRAIAAEGRAAGEYARKLDLRKSTDMYQDILAQGKQERGGWMNPYTEEGKAFIEKATVLTSTDKEGNTIHTDAQGNPITKDEVAKRTEMQLSLSELAGNTPSQMETNVGQVRRAQEEVIRRGGKITPAMRQELLLAEKADVDAAKVKLKGLEASNANIQKEVRKLELKAAGAEDKRSANSGSGRGKYKKEDWAGAEQNWKSEVSPLGFGPDAIYGIGEAFDWAKDNSIPLVVVENAISKRFDPGLFGNSVPSKAELVKAIQAESSIYTKGGGNYDPKVSVVAGMHAAALKKQLAANNKEIQGLGLSSRERKDADAKGILADVRDDYKKKPILKKNKTETTNSNEVLEGWVSPADEKVKESKTTGTKATVLPKKATNKIKPFTKAEAEAFAREEGLGVSPFLDVLPGAGLIKNTVKKTVTEVNKIAAKRAAEAAAKKKAKAKAAKESQKKSAKAGEAKSARKAEQRGKVEGKTRTELLEAARAEKKVLTDKIEELADKLRSTRIADKTRAKYKKEITEARKALKKFSRKK